jgi:hypothetical protein
LGNGHERGSCPGLDVIARIDLHRAGYSRQGGVDVGVVEIELGRLDVRLIELDRSLVLLDHEPLVSRLLRAIEFSCWSF